MKTGGLDVGTSGCKLTIFGDDFSVVAKYSRSYHHPNSNPYELDPALLQEAVFSLLREGSSAHPDLQGIGITSFGESFVLLDEEDHPLFPIYLYTNPKGNEEARKLETNLSKEKIFGLTGLLPHGMYSLPKAMWMASHYPEIFAKAKRLLLIQSYVGYLLTGAAKIDVSLAGRTMALDYKNTRWSQEILQASGIPESLLPEIVPTGSVIGKISAKGARLSGLARNCQVVAVSHDQFAAVLGAGAFEDGVAVDGAGTVQCLTPIFSQIPPAESFINNHLSLLPYIQKGSYLTYTFMYTGGALLQWCADRLQGKTPAENHLYFQSFYHGPTSLLVLPHFAGAGTPYMDPGSLGAIVGLNEATSAADIYLGAMEGIAYEMRVNREILERENIKIHRLIATGGGARSPLYLQIKANILNLPINVLQEKEAGTLGCAIAIAVALGLYPTPKEAAKKMVHYEKRILPEPERVSEYNRIYERYSRLYPAVRPLMEEIKHG